MSRREYAEKEEAAVSKKVSVRGKRWTGKDMPAIEMARRMRAEAKFEATEKKLGLR